MPIYEYQCQDCGGEFDALRRLSDDDRDVECPFCGEKHAERKMALTASDPFSFKGGCGSGSGRHMRFG
jgi:putative FmdB family regulatory protein